MTLEELYTKTLDWSYDRGILTNGKAKTQVLKLMSEMGELADNIAKGKNVEDDIGDCLVVLTNIAYLTKTTIPKCWAKAYDDIKDRKGFLNADGIFVKSTDPAYEQLKLQLDGEE